VERDMRALTWRLKQNLQQKNFTYDVVMTTVNDEKVFTH